MGPHTVVWGVGGNGWSFYTQGDQNNHAHTEVKNLSGRIWGNNNASIGLLGNLRGLGEVLEPMRSLLHLERPENQMKNLLANMCKWGNNQQTSGNRDNVHPAKWYCSAKMLAAFGQQLYPELECKEQPLTSIHTQGQDQSFADLIYFWQACIVNFQQK